MVLILYCGQWKGAENMKKIITAVAVTLIMGYIGIYIGAMMNLEGYLGVIFSIASMGAFILHSIEKINEHK